MIRDSLLKRIVETIDLHSKFDNTDFYIQTEKGKSTTSLLIKYKIDIKYHIRFEIPTFKTHEKDSYSSYYLFSGHVSPGPLSYDETFSFKGEGEVFSRIDIWLDCIWEEIAANPTVKLIESQNIIIDEIFKKFDSIEDAYFTKDEAKEMKSRLDQLEQTLSSKIKNEQKNKELLLKEIEKLHNDVETLKETITLLKKVSWVKSFTTKIFKWSTDPDNAKHLKGGYSLLKEFLPEDIKNSLPS